MIMVAVNSMEERHAVLDKAIASKDCAISTAVGVLVASNPELTIAIFRRLVANLSLILDETELPVYNLKDDRGLPCIGVAPGKPGAIFLYGVKGDALITELKDDLKRRN